jgi:hypothetical protein
MVTSRWQAASAGSTNATLTLSAYRNIAVNANITSAGGGGVVLRADNAGTGTGTATFGGGQVSTAGAVSIFYNPTGSSSTVNATKYTAPTLTNFSGNVAGGALNTYVLVNTVYDLQNIKNNLAGIYALGRDIDASATASWNGGAGFAPVGGSIAFTGTFDGQGQTISNLTINRPSGQWVGLFGYNGASATVRNLGLLNVSVTGNTATGGVVGENHGTITGVYTSGSVASNAGAGGIVGYNYGSLSNVYSTSAVSAPTIYAGGIAGLSLGNISQAYATGPGERREQCGWAAGLQWRLHHAVLLGQLHDGAGGRHRCGRRVERPERSNQRSVAVGGGKLCVQAERLCGFRLHPRQYLYRLVLDQWPDSPVRPVGIFDQYSERASASADGDGSRRELQARIQH